MNMMKAIITVFILIVFAITSVDLAFSQENLSSEIKDPELEQEFKWLKAETFVITASKAMEEINKSAASISVITDRQIRQMGARDLSDVLRGVPGFDALYSFFGQWAFAVRGGVRWPSSNVLVMINSHPIKDASTGAATFVHDTLILDNIKRIEFIRGPGSAVYGANAFHGVINIITKEAEDIDGFEITAKGGSWDTQQYNLLFGKTFSGLEVAFNFNYFKTHGYRAFIEEDMQTAIDEFWNSIGVPSNASLAPGRTNGGDEKYDVALNLKYKGFTFDGRYVERERTMPFGPEPVLNEGSFQLPEDYYLNLSYETSIMEGLDLSGKVYRNHLDLTNEWQYHPPGFFGQTPDPPDFYAIWAEGLLWENSGNDRATGVEIQATYKIWESNTIVAGATFEEQRWYDLSASANFLPTPVPGVLIQLPSLQKVPDFFLQESQRNFKAFFLEDIWDITDDIRLTAGVRYDRYSDFGSEVSPRVGLTWEYMRGYDLKLLYGHAFRAPTFNEIYFSFGLDPETVDTYEVSLGADFTSSFTGRATFYHNEEEDVIGYPSVNYVANVGKARNQGFEVEAKYDFGKGTYISGYYEYLSVKSGPGFSFYHAYLMANIRLSRHLNFNVDCNHWGSMNRGNPEDPRDDPSSLTLVNATLIAKKFLKGYEGLELRGSVYNLLDEDWSYDIPDMSPLGLPKIPNDLPAPGINFLVEMKYRF